MVLKLSVVSRRKTRYTWKNGRKMDIHMNVSYYDSGVALIPKKAQNKIYPENFFKSK